MMKIYPRVYYYYYNMTCMNDPEILVRQSCYYGMFPDSYLMDCAINLLAFNPLAVPADLDYYILSMQDSSEMDIS